MASTCSSGGCTRSSISVRNSRMIASRVVIRSRRCSSARPSSVACSSTTRFRPGKVLASAEITSAGSAAQVRAVEPAEGVAEVADRRAQHGADDDSVRGRSRRAPRRPRRWPARRRSSPTGRPGCPCAQAEPLEAQRGAQTVEHPVAGFVRCAPHAVADPRGRGPRPPSPRPERRPPAGTRTGPASRPPWRAGAARRRGSSVTTPRRSRTGRTRRGGPGSGACPAGTSTVVTVACGSPLQVGGAVEQLGGSDPLGDQPEEAQFDVAGAQHRAGAGVLEAGRRMVERVLATAARGGSPRPKVLVRGAADPLGTDGPGCRCHCVLHSYLKKGLRIQLDVPGGRSAANSSVTRSRESVKR